MTHVQPVREEEVIQMNEGLISVIASFIIIGVISAVITITFYFVLMLKEMISHARR